jgi:hypothetical protein
MLEPKIIASLAMMGFQKMFFLPDVEGEIGKIWIVLLF